MKFNYLSIAFASLLLSATANAQQKNTVLSKDWYQKDLAKDTFYGISLDQAYDFLKGKKSTSTIVAVIDGGIDTTHEDLKNIVWKNPKEIAGNGKDDDGNGYIDDIYGWNFLGNADGRDVNKEAEEKYRVYYKFKDKYSNPNIDTTKMSFWDKYDYKTWKRAQQEIEDPVKSSQDKQMANFLTMTYHALLKADTILVKSLGKNEYTISDLENYKATAGDQSNYAKMTMMQIVQVANFAPTTTNTEILKDLKSESEKYATADDARNNAPEAYRANIVHDNYSDFKDSHYGNGDVHAQDPMHGSHVAGIIAAQRNNNIGMNGVADNVKILSVRAVPDGDEYDKDIALAIRYAVDNGARVINMSFGKAYSPEKYWVDSAFEYAAQHDVLLIHAAGNESENIDSLPNYPNGDLLAYGGIQAPNLITVGASGDPRIGDTHLAANFSNYGKKTVDVFAPGERIYSTVPETSKYAYLDGTSMASPVVTGLAALIRSYFPKLSAEQVKYVIEHSVEIPKNDTTVLPGTSDQMVPFSSLSKSGGIINAYNAVKLASTLKPEKKKK